ncbi:hypothetical protein H8E88_11345 [candidate division KSB1 bacterium]|nr:hypothetical protein [candidate division KSB1 bacterium]MBL7093630.1 hypothetical protein [candidate division KSB1 bacterium]
MSIDKYQLAEKTLVRYEKLYGPNFRKVFSVANGYISRELTDGMVAGIPQKTLLKQKELWVVPIVLTKKAGGYGEIGAILIDDLSHAIVGASAKEEVLQKAELLFNEKAKAA